MRGLAGFIKGQTFWIKGVFQPIYSVTTDTIDPPTDTPSSGIGENRTIGYTGINRSLSISNTNRDLTMKSTRRKIRVTS